QVERERAGRRALPHHDVDPEVLERRIEDLLRRPAQTVDLVDEEDVVGLEGREDGGDVLLLEGRAGDRADPHVELLADDVSEARLAEARRPHEEHVVERLAARARRLERDPELLLRPLLVDEVVELTRPKALLELLVVALDGRGQELGAAHAARSASRTRSSGGRSGSVAASACSASETLYPSSTSASRATRCSLVPAALEIGTAASSPASFSFSSSTIRSAVFLPIPGIDWNRAASPSTIARRSSAGGDPDTTARATFGPTPFTARSWTKSSRSAGSANPKSWSASSRTAR